jgi:hypothetical protein
MRISLIVLIAVFFSSAFGSSTNGDEWRQLFHCGQLTSQLFVDRETKLRTIGFQATFAFPDFAYRQLTSGLGDSVPNRLYIYTPESAYAATLELQRKYKLSFESKLQPESKGYFVFRNDASGSPVFFPTPVRYTKPHFMNSALFQTMIPMITAFNRSFCRHTRVFQRLQRWSRRPSRIF